MSHFSDGQLRQLGNALEAAGWISRDMTLLGQAGRHRLIGIRNSLRSGSNIITAIVRGRTELWLAPGQDTIGGVRGHEILRRLMYAGLLASCVDLEELKAIQAKGGEFFQKHFRYCVFGWRGLQANCVPYLTWHENGVMLRWQGLDVHWYRYCFALRFKN